MLVFGKVNASASHSKPCEETKDFKGLRNCRAQAKSVHRISQKIEPAGRSSAKSHVPTWLLRKLRFYCQWLHNVELGGTFPPQNGETFFKCNFYETFPLNETVQSPPLFVVKPGILLWRSGHLAPFFWHLMEASNLPWLGRKAALPQASIKCDSRMKNSGTALSLPNL